MYIILTKDKTCTMFRQTLLLSQYSFVYNILSAQTHNISNIFLTAGCFNNIVCILVAKISFKKKLVEKWTTQGWNRSY